jgi:membrane associated rhomboid family serine protease
MIKTMPEKIITGASYCTSGGLICSGLSGAYDWLHGLDWNFIAIVSGVIFGAATYFTSLYFQRRMQKSYDASLRIYEEALKAGIITPPPSPPKEK